MKTLTNKIALCVMVFCMSLGLNAQDFQGQATYLSKSTLDLGNWGKLCMMVF